MKEWCIERACSHRYLLWAMPTAACRKPFDEQSVPEGSRGTWKVSGNLSPSCRPRRLRRCGSTWRSRRGPCGAA
eukprot:13785401-Heterocapsa_arctica.AAC.1